MFLMPQRLKLFYCENLPWLYDLPPLSLIVRCGYPSCMPGKERNTF